MAGKADGGVRDALQLDQAARKLDPARAGGAENGADAEAEQLGLFAGGSVFGTIRRPDGRGTVAVGPGRPRGSLNRSTKDLVKLITSVGRHPLLAMAEIVAMPIDMIASTLGCTRLEAAEYHRKVMSDLAPYVAQKLPTAVQIEGANAGMLVINLGGALGEQLKGLDMQLVDVTPPVIEGAIEGEQNQQVSDGVDDASHDDASHDQAK